ncbi:MAG TPA: DUF4345 domain-containing protein [Saprospiraceae bacterium]|nr:DUF4345 domain-containing protein [Saprospiraceae bacterium]HNM24498.1 DUF4345 domain-containing protein [Saprospiraceae bacterium]
MQRPVLFARIYLLLLAVATLNIALKALIDPQTVMNFVSVSLDGNVTARNSIRALYGGVNFFFALYWIYAAFRAQRTGLILAALYTGGFVFGRIWSMAADGLPGAFALQWLITEAVFMALAIGLQVWQSRKNVALAAAAF